MSGTYRTDEDGRTERLTAAEVRDLPREDRRELDRTGETADGRYRR